MASTRGRGLFIVIEGLDGAGKTTHSKALQKTLKSKGLKALLTTEPSSSPVGRFVRATLLQRRKVDPETEALMFAADRYTHLKDEIVPALESGKHVISDRYVYASIAYQGAQGLDTKWIREINRFARRPDLGIYLDVPAEIGLGRIERTKSLLEKIELQRKVREIYLELVSAGELVSVDANRPRAEIQRDLIQMALNLTGKN